MRNKESRILSYYLLIALILFQGLSGVAGGIGLILDPTGESLQIPITWLDDSPFNDYLIPGLILLIILGFLPLIVSYELWKKTSWSWLGALIIGLSLVIWIGVEIVIVGYQPRPPLQLIYGTVGIIILVLVSLPSVKRFLKTQLERNAI